MSRNVKTLNFNDVIYLSGKSLFLLTEVRVNFCFQKNDQENYAENVSRDFQFHCFSKFQSLLHIGKPWVFRFLKKMLVLTF